MQSYFEEHVKRMTMQVFPTPKYYYSNAMPEMRISSASELEVLGVLHPHGASPRFLQQRRRPPLERLGHERGCAVVGEPAPEARPAAADGPGVAEAGRRADPSFGAAGWPARGGRGRCDFAADSVALEETEGDARLRRAGT